MAGKTEAPPPARDDRVHVTTPGISVRVLDLLRRVLVRVARSHRAFAGRSLRARTARRAAAAPFSCSGRLSTSRLCCRAEPRFGPHCNPALVYYTVGSAPMGEPPVRLEGGQPAVSTAITSTLCHDPVSLASLQYINIPSLSQHCPCIGRSSRPCGSKARVSFMQVRHRWRAFHLPSRCWTEPPARHAASARRTRSTRGSFARSANTIARSTFERMGGTSRTKARTGTAPCASWSTTGWTTTNRK